MAESINGAPRYLEGREAMGKPKMQTMACWVTGGVWKKKICDLAKFMHIPEASEKSLRSDLKREAS